MRAVRAAPNVPCRGAVPVEHVEVLAGQQLAAVDAGLDGAQAAQDAHLLHVAHERHDVQALELGVHGVQPAHQVLEEQLEGLRQAQHRVALDDEGRHLLAAVVHQLALVGRGVGRGDGRRAAVARRAVVVRRRHQLQRRVVHHLQRAQQAQAGRRQRQARRQQLRRAERARRRRRLHARRAPGRAAHLARGRR